MMRTAHDRNYPAQLVSGDSMATEEFGLIAQAAEKARSLALQAVIASRGTPVRYRTRPNRLR